MSTKIVCGIRLTPTKRTPYTKREPKPKRFVVYGKDKGKTWGAGL